MTTQPPKLTRERLAAIDHTRVHESMLDGNDREAIEALLADRDRLLEACEALLGHVEADHCRVTDGEPDDDTREDVLRARAAIAESRRT